MEEAIPGASLTNHIHDHHMHNILDVQKNADFIMEHLNDPNIDLSQPPSFNSAIGEEPTKGNKAIYFDKSDTLF